MVATIVYINGFLAPKNDILVSQGLKDEVRIIQVNPSNVSSIHDRVMQIFYELKGGRVHYGKEHSQFHGHSEVGSHEFPGLLRDWDAEHPVHLVGHSFGGLTARVFQQYLAQGDMFEGYSTSVAWVTSVVAISSPLNGGLLVYPLGAHSGMPPIVRVGSFGYGVSLIMHIIEYFDVKFIKQLYDFNMSHWNLKYNNQNALKKALHTLLGICIHSTTDNSAYDMTLHSQLNWSKYLKTSNQVHYLSITGTNSYSPSTSWLHKFFYSCRVFMLRRIPSAIMYSNASTTREIRTTEIVNHQFDGMLFHKEQNFPWIDSFSETDEANHKHDNEAIDDLASLAAIETGKWYVLDRDMDHVGIYSDSIVWETVINAVKLFEKCRTERGESHDKDYAGSKVVDIHRAHMQTPVWSGKVHSDYHSSSIYKFIIAVGLLLTAALITFKTNLISVGHPPLLGSLLSVGGLILIVPNNPDAIECVFSSLRTLVLIGSYFLAHDMNEMELAVMIISLTYVGELVTYFLRASIVCDYLAPLSKLCLATGVLTTSLQQHSINPLVGSLIVLNCACILTDIIWYCAELKYGVTSLFIGLSWCAYSLLLIIHICIIVNFEAPPLHEINLFLMYLVVSWIFLQKFRSFSEAYQLICIKNRWLC